MIKKTLSAFLLACLLYTTVYLLAIKLLKIDINNLQDGLIMMLITRVILCENKQKELEDDQKYKIDCLE